MACSLLVLILVGYCLSWVAWVVGFWNYLIAWVYILFPRYSLARASKECATGDTPHTRVIWYVKCQSCTHKVCIYCIDSFAQTILDSSKCKTVSPCDASHVALEEMRSPVTDNLSLLSWILLLLFAWIPLMHIAHSWGLLELWCIPSALTREWRMWKFQPGQYQQEKQILLEKKTSITWEC
jgi:hypothetical protein